MTTEPQTIRSHPWEKAGLGRAPFRFLTMDKSTGDGCHYCGTGIVYRFHCISSDGKRFHVGCDCIAKCHMPSETIVVQSAKALKTYKRDAAATARRAKLKAEAEARKARWEAERVANVAKLATDPLYARIKAVVGVATRDGANGFLVDMRDNMEKFGHLTEGQEAAAVRILDRIENEPARKAASQHIGTVGARVTITATVEFSKCIYASTNRCYDPDRWINKIRTEDGAAVIWFGNYGLKVGEKITGTASVKEHQEYQGERQTLIKNPRWKDAS